MPTYDYRCDACGKEFEHFQSMKEEPLQECLVCGEKGRVTRLISSGGGIIFKGTGFYVTDYKKDNKTGSVPTEKKDTSPSNSATAASTPEKK
ncbi:MAG: zinc ribbon domain-containing protein [Leptospiraceae bacterium]|nr:zinc ribbon domain-containing protein [Leptospiraceae bacterium]MCK6382179.1 zinc ribbon domain-containing protein [Leptospiraceae bacterium]